MGEGKRWPCVGVMEKLLIRFLVAVVKSDEHYEKPTPAGHEEMSISEIMLGKGNYYPGLIPLVYAYLGHIGCDSDTMDTIDQVWDSSFDLEQA